MIIPTGKSFVYIPINSGISLVELAVVIAITLVFCAFVGWILMKIL